MESADPISHPLATRDELRGFYDAMLPLVYRYFVRRCGASGIAEDLTQDTFLSAAKEIRKGSDVREPDRWIFGLARHRLVDHFRAQEREQRRLRLVWQAEQASERADEGAELSRERARVALGAIPPAQRLVLTLRYLDGMSVPGVASAIGRSVHATESLLARGRSSFRRVYEEADDD
jgi:RNA polymerase sigma-70 factor (ECF subfamily)